MFSFSELYIIVFFCFQTVKKDKNNWTGHIDKILDIEENLCCPKLGLKGKIDATVQVTIHERNGKKNKNWSSRIIRILKLKTQTQTQSIYFN